MEHARVPYECCPLCGHDEAALVREGDASRHPLFRPGLPARVRWVRCKRCDHLFTGGWFGPEALALLFSSANADQIPGRGDVVRARALSARIVERAVDLRGGALGRWLDVGFGNGALVTTAAEFGFEAVGLDVRAEPVRLLRAFGFPAVQADLMDYQPEAPFEVVSLADVLEHLPFPLTALDRVRDLLAPGGLAFLSTPNAESFLWRALELAKKNPYWDEIEHYHAFGRSRLQALLRERGLEPVRYAISERYQAGMELYALKVG